MLSGRIKRHMDKITVKREVKSYYQEIRGNDQLRQIIKLLVCNITCVFLGGHCKQGNTVGCKAFIV